MSVLDLWERLYGGLPGWATPIFVVALVFILLSMISIAVLVVQSIRQARLDRRMAAVSAGSIAARHGAQVGDPSADDYLWVFVVPALNEEITIADSVGRLAQIEVANRVILVINDGSDDRTGEVLAGMDARGLTVFERRLPEARQGKSEALNDAWRYLHSRVLGAGGVHEGWDPHRVIVTIVDADGRLDAVAAARVTSAFADDRIGGVQARVRIYNRRTPLTWGQDVEFGVFGAVYQRGRTRWGTANMGGNGQFNRLSALDQVAAVDALGRRGPWRAGRLTEDQDIGLRMIHAGWRGAQSAEVAINQQGLNSLRALYRQRTRWAQGNWQVLDMLGQTLRDRHLSLTARIDQFWYLLTPVVQAWVGISLLLSVIFLAIGVVHVELTLWLLLPFYLFSALPGIVSVLLARDRGGFFGFLRDLLLAHWYLIYSWLIYPVLYRALARQLLRRNGWAKTQRERIQA